MRLQPPPPAHGWVGRAAELYWSGLPAGSGVGVVADVSALVRSEPERGVPSIQRAAQHRRDHDRGVFHVRGGDGPVSAHPTDYLAAQESYA